MSVDKDIEQLNAIAAKLMKVEPSSEKEKYYLDLAYKEITGAASALARLETIWLEKDD